MQGDLGVRMRKAFRSCDSFSGTGQVMVRCRDRSARHRLGYGLVDIGVGAPEIGVFSLSSVRPLKGRLGLGVERDLAYVPRPSLADLARAASASARIVW